MQEGGVPAASTAERLAKLEVELGGALTDLAASFTRLSKSLETLRDSHVGLAERVEALERRSSEAPPPLMIPQLQIALTNWIAAHTPDRDQEH